MLENEENVQLENNQDEIINEPELTKDDETSLPYQEEIEKARTDLFTQYNKSRKVSNLLMIVVVIAICGAMFMVISNNQVLTICGYVLAGLLVVGMIVYYALTKNKFPTMTREYIKNITATLNKRNFEDKRFKEVSMDPSEKLDLATLLADGVYQEATNVASRNLVHGSFLDHHFLCAEGALTKPGRGKNQVPPYFVGKYVSIPNDLHFEGRIVITLKNIKSPLDLPNGVNDLKLVEESSENTLIYVPEGLNYKEILNNKVLQKLSSLKIENHLLNVNVVFWAGHSAAYLSYDDAVMALPFDKPFNYEANEGFAKDLLVVLEALIG